MSSDSHEIHSLLSDSEADRILSGPHFTAKDYYWVPDQNNGSYQGGQIIFDTQLQTNSWNVWADAYLEIPLTVQAVQGGTAYTELDPVSFKQSVLSLINGIQIEVAGSQTVVPLTTNNQISAQTRLWFDASKDSPDTTYLQLSKSKLNNGWLGTGSAQGLYYSQTTALAQTTAGTLYPSNNPFNFVGATGAFASTGSFQQNQAYNPGFDNGVVQFKCNSTYASNKFYTNAVIGLKYIHDFFRSLDFPALGLRFRMTFNTPITQSTSALTQSVPLLVGSVNSAGSAIVKCTNEYRKPQFEHMQIIYSFGQIPA